MELTIRRQSPYDWTLPPIIITEYVPPIKPLLVLIHKAFIFIPSHPQLHPNSIPLITMSSDNKSIPLSPPTTEPPRCATCRKAATGASTPLSRCAKCKTTTYCSRVCQVTDWKSHKKACGKLVLPPPVTPPGFPAGFQWFNHPFFAPVPEAGGINDLHSLTRYAVVTHMGMTSAGWLSAQDRATCFSNVIDAYRIRMQEENGVYPGVFPDRGYKPVMHFHHFMKQARKADCLPAWWHEDHTRICGNLATREDGGACIMRPVTTGELMNRYGEDGNDWKMVITQLRRVAREVYGTEAQRPNDPHFLEYLPYIRVNGQWGVLRPQEYPILNGFEGWWVDRPEG